jgi:hypothetical protein
VEAFEDSLVSDEGERSIFLQSLEFQEHQKPPYIRKKFLVVSHSP